MYLIITGLYLGTNIAQNIKNCSIDNKKYCLEEKIVNGVIKYFDINGKELTPHPVYSISVQERINKGYTKVSNYSNKITRPNYTVTYLDVADATGKGFDDPSLGATRRATFEAALTNILLLITNTGSVDIEVQLSESDAKGALASGGPLFSSSPGFMTPGTARHITTGKDPFGPTFPDAKVTFDFGYKWNSTMNDPATDEYDMFSVSLHELMHTMGFTSLIASTGESQVGNSVYLSFDQFILNSTSSVVIDGSPPVIQTVVTDLTSNSLKFEIITGMISPIYSPVNFSTGSSMSHFDNNRISGVTYVMNPSISSGKKVRTLHADEINVLPKLGYSIESEYLYNGITDNQTNITSSFEMYPNPAISEITIGWGNFKSKNFSIKLTNILGSEIIKINSKDISPVNNSTKIDISFLPNGVYFMSFENGTSKSIKKFIKK